MKKAQAAIEFLTTYGWAILIIIIAIAALASFGVLNPSKNLPDKCIFSNNINCPDYQIDSASHHTQLWLTNNQGQKLYVDADPTKIAFMTDTNVACTTTNSNIPKTEWPSEGKILVDCDVTSMNLVKKDKGRVKITVTYKKVNGGFNNIALGEVYATVQ